MDRPVPSRPPLAVSPTVVAALWSEVLGRARVRPDDAVVALGADSLHMTRMVARIRQVFGVKIPFRLVFDAATPADLAGVIRASSEDGNGARPPGLGADQRAANRAPLSQDQRRLWLLDQNGEAGAAYNLPLVLRLRGPLDETALRAALADLVERHAVLRTRIVVDAHQPWQQIQDEASVELTLVEVDGGLAEAMRLVAELVHHRCDLTAAPPWRAAIYRLASQDHLLAFVFHHTLYDGWSEAVLRTDLSALYAAHHAGAAPDLPPLSMSYASWASWQADEEAVTDIAGHMTYWRRQLRDMKVTELPTTRPRPPQRSDRGAGLAFTVDAHIGAGVRDLAQRHGATPFMVLLAAWNALLSRYCGQADVSTGTSMAGRGHPDVEALIGSFVNIFVVRADLSGRPTFADLLRQVKETVLDAFLHQDVPFDRLVAELAPARDGSRNPLFNVMFAYLNMPVADDRWPDLDVERIRPPTRTTTFDVTLSVQDQPDGSLRGDLEYSTDLFGSDAMRRLGEHFTNLLRQAVADPDRPVEQIPMLSDDDRHRLLVEPIRPVPLTPTTIPAAVAAQNARTPDAPAVISAGQRLTYAELTRRAGQLANHLRGLHVGPEVGVAIRLPRGVDQVVALLGVLTAGGYAIPLDDEHPTERIADLLRLAQPYAVLTVGDGRDDAARRCGIERVIRLDRDRELIDTLDPAPPVPIDPDNAAAAIFTSGSTGTPKAVLITHGNVLSAHAARAVYGLPPQRLLLPVSFAFDVFLSFAVWTLASGGQLVIPVRERGVDTDELAELLREQQVTHLVAPPNLQRSLLARGDVRSGNHLVAGIAGGEACPLLLAEDYRNWTLGARLLNEYGLTETSMGTVFGIEGSVHLDSASGQLPIGRPMANVHVYLLDDGGQPVPIGIPGEVYLGGPGITRGYLGDPSRTAERFVPDPFGPVPGGRLYRTGDLAQWRDDGNLQFLGRRDGQVKIRGLRIELGEIEAALARHPLVAEAAVCPHNDNQQLVAFVTAADDADPDERKLREHLQQLLPEPMLPARIVRLPQLPTAATGKVDRAALGQLELDDTVHGQHTPPRTPAERTVAAVWAETLEVQDIDVYADFFALGGHSLLAAGVVSRLRAAFPVPIELRDLFATPTVAGLAALIGARMLEAMRDQFGAEVTAEGDGHARGAEQAQAVRATIRPVDRSAPLPLSAGQEQLWLEHRLNPNSGAYQVPVSLRLHGELDLTALRETLDGLVARHEVLRTRIDLVDEEPVQLIDPAPRVPVRVLAADSPEAAELLLREQVTRPFDLTAEHPLRVALCRLGATDHILLLVLHHVACDGTSVRLLLEELATRYDAAVHGEPVPVPDLSVQYADYAVWYRGRTTGSEYRSQRDYWRHQLDGVQPLSLPLAPQVPKNLSDAGGCLPFELGQDVSARLQRYAAERGVTPFVLLLAGLKAMFYRLGCGTDVAVGTPVAGRRGAELERVLGYFGNTVVLRTDVSGSPSFATLVERVRRVAADGLAAQEVALAHVVRDVARHRGDTRNPLFNVLFAHEYAGAAPPQLAGLTVQEFPLPVDAVQFALTLRLTEHPDGILTGELDHLAAAVDAGYARRIARWYVRILDLALAEPDRTIDELALLDNDDLRDLARWNDTTVERDEHCLHELVLAQAEQTPEGVAVVSGDALMSYADLRRRATALSHRLRGLGVTRGSVVGVCLPRSPELAVTLLAALMAGAAYLPLDPAHPSRRLAGIVRRHRVDVLVATPEVLFDWQTPPNCVVVDPTTPCPEPDGARLPQVDPDDVAYLITTSGSTGEPKGVLVPHRGIVNRIMWSVTEHTLGPGDRILQKTTVSFDAAVWEIFAPLVAGATLVMARPGAERDPTALVDDVRRHRITILQAVPTMWRLLSTEPDLAACGSLRLLLSAGEVLTADLCRQLTDRVGATLVNTYGPTECAIDVTAWTYQPGDQYTGGDPVPIGRPIDNIRIHVLDNRCRPVPVGVVGELHVAGSGLARGYDGLPDLTAERFLPDPFSPVPGGRLYRTGDVARWRPDGTLDILGRRDRQLKVRGVRVEAAEIEAALLEHSGVRAAAVIARPDVDGGPQLVAYVVPENGDQPPSDLPSFLADQLPAPMIPACVVALPELPLTSSGKLDRAALPEPAPLPSAADTYQPPRSATEEIVTGVWAAVLGLERVGIDDDFFQLGGHSLTAAQIVARLRAALDRPVALAEVLTARTPAELARRVDSLTAGVGGVGSVSRGEPVLLSFAQQRLWFLEQLQPGGVAYLVPWVLRLRGRLDVAVLRRAVEELVVRHEVLRTRYAVRDGVPVQVVDEGVELDWAVVDAVGGDVDGLVRAECRQPVDLVSGPVVRVRLLRCGVREHVLVVVLHHIACDGWSVGVLARELRQLYAGFVGGGSVGLPPVGVQYADFAAWQRRWLSGEVLDRQVRFWRERLAGLAPLELPTDRPRPPVPDDSGDVYEFEMPAALTRQMEKLGHEQGATLFMVLAALYAALLARYTRQRDISVGTPVSGRHWSDLENTVGLFVNTLVLRTSVEAGDTFLDLLARVRANTLDALAHQELPFERLVEELQIDRDLSRNPLFQVMFELQEIGETGTAGDGLDIQPLPVARDTAKFDLTLALARRHDGSLAGEVEYATALFDRDTAVRLVTHFLRLAAEVAAAPDRPVALLSLVEGQERRRILDEWSGGVPVEQSEGCLPDLLAERFRAAPDMIAVTDGTRTLTAAQLDARANQVAHHLRDVGVQPEKTVAVLLRRGIEVPAVLLAVLRAGGVYVPIDPDSPPERLAYLLTDVGATVVITSREHVDRIPPGIWTVLVDTDHHVIAGRSVAPLRLPVRPGNLAYVIYTSGSTGRPKGVMIEHRSYAQHCRVIADRYDIRPGDRVVLLSALTFDVAMDQIGATLLAGATIVVGGEDFWSPADLADRLGEHRVTHMEITPAHYRELMRGVAAHDPRLRHLRLMNVGSDVVTVDDARRWQSSELPGRFLCNYGPTEATVTCLLHDVEDVREVGSFRTAATLPIGRPVPGTRAYIVDELLNPVPAGVPGELLIGGLRLARGYLRQPGLTAERFIPDPFSGLPGARLYRTGDLVRYRVDGVIEFLGRIDTQVKIRGFRIELGEIEMVLGEQPGVDGAVVTVYEPRRGDRTLAAYVVPAKGARLDIAELRAALRDRIPEYMVPSYWTELDELPLTSSNKVDRRALPAPAHELAAVGTTPPVTDAEKAVAQVWEEVLGRSGVGATDNFFDLGGHSLLATRVRAMFQERFGVDLPLRVLFQAVTVTAQAREVEEAVLRDFDDLPTEEITAMDLAMEAQ